MSDNRLEPFLIDGCFVASGSMLSAIKRCPTYAFYKYVAKRERTGGVAKGRGPGKAWHDAQLELYRHAADGVLTDEGVQAAHTALEQAYDGAQLVEGDEHLHLLRMKQTLDAYVDGSYIEMGKGGANGIYKHAGYRNEPFRVLGCESFFAARIGEVEVAGLKVPVIYLGFLDILASWKERGELIVIDTKTMRKWDASKVVEWRRAAAPVGYAACFPQYVREGLASLPPSLQAHMQPHEPQRLALAAVKRVDGFCLNAVVMRASTDMTRCKNPHTEFHRELFYYDDTRLDGWRADALLWSKTWLEWCAAGQWPETDSMCSSYFGKVCPYECVCSLVGEQREVMLGTDVFADVTRGYLKDGQIKLNPNDEPQAD